MGQMLRGGRSCPADKKVIAGTERSGKDVLTKSLRGNASGTLPNSGVMEHDAEHKLHLSGDPLLTSPL